MSLERIKELLAKQHLVEELVHNQHMSRQQLVEDIVHRQHHPELYTIVEKMEASELGGVLEALSITDAQHLYSLIPFERTNEILWEISDELREQLVGSRDIGFSENQLNAFELVNGKLRKVPINSRKDLENVKPIWVDLLKASRAERKYVADFYQVDLPDPHDASNLEVSTRFHLENEGDIHLHANFLLDRAGDSRSVPVAFILRREILFSLRDEDLPVFRLQLRRALAKPGFVSDSKDLLLELYGADVEYSSDSLEGIYHTLDRVGKEVLSQAITDDQAAAILSEIAEEENLNGRIRNNILDTQRALSFLMRCKVLSSEQLEDTRQILRDIESLNSHTAFLFDKINFLMDATIGFININQNKRVNQLTMFSVVIMPINIIAGIGGMSEYSMMTQGLPWPVAYGLFVSVMGLIGWATYVALKHVETRKMKSLHKNTDKTGVR